ncbi:fibronectin type III domain-containing protein [Chryseosolibacter indicus]|uniref:Fibronectin type III domain-containing protein n=1 Tax=Chryseosolibacter indicus TaxID=2782351 RepID=A0ABS5VWZ4_9BACT|nr:fibronectin type III domain-containing protein [Chryseosolibacter indicus]MBT1705940.1 fibronectin type III domain-containing protein [Chryseosolibacter indicus]
MKKFLLSVCMLLFGIGAYATTYYVRADGNDSNNGLSNSPAGAFKTIAKACEKVPAGAHLIIIGEGVFTETFTMQPKEGVSVRGQGVGVTIIRFPQKTDVEEPVFSYVAAGAFDLRSINILEKGGIRFVWDKEDRVVDRLASVDGNQEISHFTLDGVNELGFEGIRVLNRNNVKIHDVEILNFSSSGINIEAKGQATVSNTEIYNFTIKESGYEGTDRSLGNITVYGDQRNITIRNGTIEHLTKNSGYGIKVLRSWADYQRKGDYIRNMKIDRLIQHGKDSAAWDNGKAANIAIEFWWIAAEGVEISNCDLTNAVSMEFNAPLTTYPYAFWLHHNKIKVGYAAIGETAVSNIIYEHNYIDYRENSFAWGVFGEFNSGNGTLNPGTPIQNLIVRNNIFDLGTRQPSFFVFTSKVENIQFYNNTINAIGGTPTLFEMRRPYSNGSNSFKVFNNIFDFEHGGSFQVYIYNEGNDGAAPANSIFKNNMYPTAPTLLPTTFSTTPQIIGPAELKRTGNRFDTYFQPIEHANAVDQGIVIAGVNDTRPYKGNAPDLGYFESEGVAMPDTEAPTAPQNLRLVSQASSAVELAWNASTDNRRVVAYEVYLGNQSIGTSTTTVFSVTGLNTNTTYNFTVKARDLANNVSQASNKVYATLVGSAIVNPLIALAFNENTGNSITNTGSAATSLVKTDLSPVWSTNVPSHAVGVSSIDFGTTPGNYVVESNGVVSELKGLRSFTITGWVNCRSSDVGPGGNRIISWINGGADGVDLVYRSDGSLQMGINGWPDGSPASSSANKITTQSSAPAANWVFFAVTYESSTSQVKFYFGNKTSDATLDLTRNYNKGVVGSNIAKLAVGHFNSVTRGAALDRMFRGLIDDIRVYGTSLPASDIITVQKSNLQDIVSPSVPTALVANGITSTSVSLLWSASTDNIGVTGYEIYRESTLIGTSNSTSFTVTGLTPNTNYTFSVTAKDAAGNISELSNPVNVKTNAAPTTTTVYEAEASGNTFGPATWINGNIVKNVGNEVGYIQFNSVSSTTSENKTLKIYYINGDANARTGLVTINGATTLVTFPPTSTWNTIGVLTMTISLNAGNNIIKIHHERDNYAPDFDRIEVTGTATAARAASENLVINSDPTQFVTYPEVYPNPVKDGVIRISLPNKSNNVTRVVIRNVSTNEIVYQQEFTADFISELQFEPNLLPGIYVLYLSDGNMEKYTRIMIY